MNSARLSRGSSQTAVLVRLVAFLVAIASVVVIPSVFVAAATGHVTSHWAFATAGVAAALTLLTSLAARSLDPLRG